MTAILSTALAAGMVATVNPCGFAMLPAYLGYFLTGEAGASKSRVATVALVISAGFLVVFATAGTLIAIGLRAVVSLIPWLALAIGLGLVVVGLGQIAGKRLLPYVRGPSGARKESSLKGMFVFGVAYAVASLSCTLPIFLSLVGTAVAASSSSQALLIFLMYGLGMAIVVSGLTVLVAGGRRTLVERMRSLGRRVDLIAGWVMLAAGVFIVWYWATALSAGALALGSNPLVRWIDETSAALTGFIARNVLAVALTALTLIAIWLGFESRRRGEEDEPAPVTGQPMDHPPSG